ncbi:MAG: hypothetical protein ABI273_20200 [Lacunisphaera sp.]
MPRIPILIDELRRRSDITVEDQKHAWLICIPKSEGLACEITIPFRVLEWFADVKRNGEEKKIWSDWMDYTGYDDSPEEKLEAAMADDISAFIQRVTASKLSLPLQIYEKTA